MLRARGFAEAGLADPALFEVGPQYRDATPKGQRIVGVVEIGQFPGFVLGVLASKVANYKGHADLKGMKIGIPKEYRVDGMPADILKANVVFRAVVVPPGTHRVRFSFHPFAGAMAEIGDKLSAVRR